MRATKDLFVSYSRRQLLYASRLVQELSAMGFSVWFDQNDIPLAVDFLSEIERSVRHSHNFIFLLSPDSANSVYCRKELEYALEYGKRILPVICVETPAEQVGQLPEVVGRLNWINGHRADEAGLSQTIAMLADVIRNGGDPVNLHTELICRAHEWKAAYYPDQLLLTGTLRRKAEQWLQGAVAEIVMQSSQPTDLLCHYICESRKNAGGASDVFICYASDDRDTRDWIVNELTRNGITSWKHDADIVPGAPFDQAIRNGIDRADNILLLLSPAMLQSEYCARELEYATAHNKRILVLAVAPMTGVSLPEGLAGLQYIPFTRREDLSEGLLHVIREIVHEKQYYARHRAFLVRARLWEAKNRHVAELLRGNELRQAQAWMTVASGHSQHPVPALIAELVDESIKSGASTNYDVLVVAGYDDNSDFAAKTARKLRKNKCSAYYPASDEKIDALPEAELEGAATFLLVLSASEEALAAGVDCHQLAGKLGKRVVLAFTQVIAPEQLPPELRDIPSVTFGERGEDDVTSLGKLLHLLTLDRDYISMHTRWAQAARNWSGQERSTDTLPRGKALAEAKRWLDDAEINQRDPAPTALQYEFIYAAIQHEARETELEKRREEYLRELEQENQNLKNSEDWMSRSAIVDSVAAGEEAPQRLPVDRVFVGREAESSLFSEHISQAEAGACSCVLIEGEQGSGKRFFAEEMTERLLQEGFRCIRCSVPEDAVSPFSALSELADDLVAQLLKDEEELAAIQLRLEAAVSDTAKVLTDIMPRLSLLLGDRPAVPELEPHQARQRLKLALAAFLGAVQGNRPLAIVINDIELASEGLLELLAFLVSPGAGLHSFLLAVTCVPGVPEVRLAFEHATAGSGEKVHEIILGNLQKLPLAEWFSRLLSAPLFSTLPLAEEVFAKTDGNPFLVREMLLRMHEEKLLVWNVKTLTWEWDLEAISALVISRSVDRDAQLTVERLDKTTRDALTVAACIGVQFSFNLLRMVYSKVFYDTLPDLLHLAHERLLVPAGDAYKLLLPDNDPEHVPIDPQFRFATGRLRRAVLDAADPTLLQVIHLETGRRLLSRLQTDNSEMLYNVATHLNEASDLLRGRKMLLLAARCNMQVGENAMQSGAYQTALHFLAKGVEEMSRLEGAWEKDYPLTFRLHLLHARSLFFSGHAQEASAIMERLIEKAQGLDDKANCYITFCDALQSNGRAAESLERVREGLSLFDVRFPQGDEAYIAETNELIDMLTQPGITDQLAQLVPATEHHLLEGELYRGAVICYYFVEPQHLPWICSRNLAHAIRYGYSSGARQAMAWFSMILMLQGKRDLSMEYAALAVDESPEHTDSPLSRGQTALVAWGMSLSWKYPFATSGEQMDIAFQRCHHNGDPQYAGYALITVYIARLMQADDLPTLMRHCLQWRDHCARFAPLELGQARIRTAQLQRLMDIEPTGPTDAEAIIDAYERDRNNTDVCESLIELARVSLIFNEDENAYMYSRRADPLMQAGAAGMLLFNFLHWYVYAVCCARIYAAKMREGSPIFASQYAAQGEAQLEKLRSWAAFNPRNFEPYYDLAAAEWAAARQDESQAMALYLKVAVQKRADDYPLLRAMAEEGLARFAHARGYYFAHTHAHESVRLYAQCGALGKARQLEAWMNAAEGLRQISYTRSLLTIDENALVRALLAQSECSTIVQLLEKTMHYLCTMAGARKAVLLQQGSGDRLVLAYREGEQFELQPSAAPKMDTTALQPTDAAAPEDTYRNAGALALALDETYLLYAEPVSHRFSAAQKNILRVLGEHYARLSCLLN